MCRNQLETFRGKFKENECEKKNGIFITPSNHLFLFPINKQGRIKQKKEQLSPSKKEQRSPTARIQQFSLGIYKLNRQNKSTKKKL